MVQVVEINDIAKLAPYREDWHALLVQTPQATFFHSLEWLEAYWHHFGRVQQLRTLLVLDGDRIAGILPLTIATERTKVGPVRVLTYPLGGWGSFYGPIGPDAATTLREGFAYLKSTRRTWDVLELRWIRACDSQADFVEQALREAGIETETKDFEQVAMIDLAGTWEEYWSRTKSHERTNIRRGQRKLEGLGQVTHVRYRPRGEAFGDADPRWDLYAACERVAERSWQGNADEGNTLSNETVRGFYRDSHLAAARAGAVDISVLELDGHAVAFAYSSHYRGYVYVIKVGFDPDLAHTGAGKILLQKTIEDSFRRGDHTIDLGPESFHYKRFWLTNVETSYRVMHFATTSPKAQTLRLARWARDLVTGPTPVDTAEASTNDDPPSTPLAVSQ